MDGASFEEDGLGLGPESAQGGDELIGPIVSPVVIDLRAEALEVSLDSARQNVEVDPAAAYLVESGGHLREKACRDEPWTASHEEADAARHRRQRRDRRPGFGQRSALLEEAVAESRGDKERVVAELLGGFHDLAQIVKRRRAFSTERTDVGAVAVDWDEPVEPRLGPDCLCVRRHFVAMSLAGQRDWPLTAMAEP